MSVIKVIEIMAESGDSWEKAAKEGVKKVADTVKNVRSAYIQDQSLTIKNGEIDKYRVNLKITFEVD